MCKRGFGFGVSVKEGVVVCGGRAWACVCMGRVSEYV